MKNYEGRVIMLELRELENGARLLASKKQAKIQAALVRKHLLNREYHIETFLMGKNNNVNSLSKASNALNKAKVAKNASVQAAKNASVYAQRVKTVAGGKMAAKALVYSKDAERQLNKAFVTYPNVVERRGRFVVV
jgi:hypothetical protein